MKRAIALLLIVILLCTTAPPVFAESGGTAMPEQSDYVANEILIMQKADAAYNTPLPLESARIIDTSALDSQGNYRLIKGTVAYGTDIEKLCRKLERRADIISADPNYIQQVESITLPAEACNDSYDYNDFNWYRDSLQLKQAWENADSLGGSVTVAVIDTGLNTAHKEFEGALWDDGEGHCGYYPYEGSYDVTDTNGHGTNVAGIIAMRANDFGYVGIAPEVKIMPLKATTPTGMTDDSIILCLNYAIENGADIINMSYSGTYLSATMAYAYQRACLHAVLIAAAGNSGASAEQAPEYPAACSGVIGVMSYGSYNSSDITNYAIDNGKLSSFSNYDASGQYYQIAAPGVQILGPSHKNNSSFTMLSGTSQATPIVSGAAALYLSTHPDATPYQVRRAIIDTADATLHGCEDSNSYKRLDLPELVNATPAQDSEVALNAQQLQILNRSLQSDITSAHQSDLEAVNIIPRDVITTMRDNLQLLARFESLQLLDLSSFSLTDADVALLADATFPRLQRLDISDNPALSSLPVHAAFAPRLTQLYADACAFQSAEDFRHFTHLQTLSVDENPISTSYAFTCLPQLLELSAASCRLQDVRQFGTMQQLCYLNVSNNYISDVSPLACYKGKYLNISDNPLHLGERQNYVIRSIDRFMKDNPYRYAEISFLHDNPNGGTNAYIRAQSLTASTLCVPRSSGAATVAVQSQAANANVACACIFSAEDSFIKVNTFTGEVEWTPAAITASRSVPILVTPVSGFPSFESAVQIQVPAIVHFSYEEGAYTLLANAATERVVIGEYELTAYTQSGDTRAFSVPAALPYSAALLAVPYDSVGAGEAAHLGLQRKARENSAAKVLNFTADRQTYHIGDTALLQVQTTVAATQVKLYDCVTRTAIISAGGVQSGTGKCFTFRLPIQAAQHYKFKAYATEDGSFSIGAKVLSFTSEPTVTALTLSSDTSNTLYFKDGCDTLSLTASVYPAEAAESTEIAYTSADETIAHVAQDGTVSAVNYGSTVITATAANGVCARFPVFVSAPKLSAVSVYAGDYNVGSLLKLHTNGAEELVLKNADGSDLTFPYECEPSEPTADGFDCAWTVYLYTNAPQQLHLNVFPADTNGCNAYTNLMPAILTPNVPAESFSFEQSSYSFERTAGAVTIRLQTAPAACNEYFNWSISSNTVASLTGYANYAVLKPKKAGTLLLTASTMRGEEEVTASCTVTFTQGRLYSATLPEGELHCYDVIPIEVVTDTTVRYLNITDTDNGLSEEFSSYAFYEDTASERLWHIPFSFKRESTALRINGGDALGALDSYLTLSVSVTMPEADFAANPSMLKGVVGASLNFQLITLPERGFIPYAYYSVSVLDPDIATYNLGTVRLLKEGETVLHCTYGEEQKDVRLVVSNPVQSISLNETQITLEEGAKYNISAKTQPESAEPILYVSSDTTVASVDAGGQITACSAGTAIIRVYTASGVNASVEVRVKTTEQLTQLAFDSDNYDLLVGDMLEYALQADIGDLTNQLTYFSSNSNILSVTADGEFTALKEGTVTIGAMAENGVCATAQVSVHAQRALILTRQSITMSVSEFVTVTTYLRPAKADLDGSWYSDNSAVASVTQGGYISAKSPGTCHIYFISDRGEVACCRVTVNSLSATKLRVTESSLTLTLPENHIIAYTATPSYTTEQPSFKSSNEKVAAVDQNGIIYSVSEGTAFITISLKNGNMYQIYVTVSAARLTLSGSANARTLRAQTLSGSVTEHTVSGAFRIEDIAPDTYRFTLSAPHHTTVTVEDAALLSDTDLGNLHLCNGDANGDGVVDLADISLVLKTGNFSATAAAAGEDLDINDDGTINIADIGEILLNDNYGGSNKTIIF